MKDYKNITIIEFIEDCLGIKLLEYQKVMITLLDKSNDKSIIFPRCSKHDFYNLYYVSKCILNSLMQGKDDE